MKCKTFSELKVPEFFKRLRITTQKNEIFFQGIVLVNLDKSAVFYWFVHIYWRMRKNAGTLSNFTKK